MEKILQRSLLKFLTPIRDYGFFDKIIALCLARGRKDGMNRGVYKRSIKNATDNGEVWVCFLPWNVSVQNAERFGIIPRKGKLILYECPFGIVHTDALVSKRLLFDVVRDLQSLAL